MPYRALHDMMVSDEFQGPGSLDSWFQDHGAEAGWLQDFDRRARPDVRPDVEDLWRLYALGRVLDLPRRGVGHRRASRLFSPAGADIHAVLGVPAQVPAVRGLVTRLGKQFAMADIVPA